MKKTYLEIAVARGFFPESSKREVLERRAPTLKGNEYGFRFYEVEEISVDGELLTGNPKNHTSWTYKGKVYDRAKVVSEIPDNRILLSNMDNNGYSRVVECCGGMIPLRDEDKVIGE